MRIARVRHLFYPYMPRDYFFELSRRQAKAGHEVDVLTWNRNSRRFEERVTDGFTIHGLPGFNFSVYGAVTEYPYLPSLPSKIVRLKPEIMHAESHLFLTTVQAVKVAKKLGVLSVVTVHGVMAKRGKVINLAQYGYLRTFGLWLFKNADRIICLTKSDAQEIIGFGCPSEKIRVIPNAVDADRFRPGRERQENLIVWVGRFVPEKGLKYLIKAAKIVVKESKDIEFTLVGYGPLEANIMKLAFDYGLLNDTVHFTGPLDRNQVAAILGKASIAVLPSLKEGLPLSLLEAMSCGTAVVASKIPGINEVIRNDHNAILIPPKEPELLAKSMMELLKNKRLRENLGRNARRTVLEKYSWSVVMNDMERLYRQGTQLELN